MVYIKRPLTKGPPWKYDIKPRQHKLISKARWIFYCLPDFSEASYQEVAIFHCKFVPASDDGGIQHQKYYRWGSFARAIIVCQEGVVLEDDKSIGELVEDMYANPKDVYLSLNKKAEELYIIRDIHYEVEMEHEPA